jgi:hypothetical protein
VSTEEQDRLVRLAAFQFLDEQSRIWGDVLPWRVISQGFLFGERRVPLVSQQGIFKPAVLRTVPLSIRTTPILQGRDRPYDDGMTPDGLLLYRYRGTDTAHRENAGLRQATELLDAAHILPDSHPRGEPVVSNGLALCKLHHAAFDGPMLRHALQEVNGSPLTAPARQDWKPGVEFLEERYEQFRQAG